MRKVLKGVVVAFAVMATILVSGGAATAVIGGTDAVYHGSRVSVEISGIARCTGSVVTLWAGKPSSWVLTSGDCAELARTAPTEIVVGTVDRTQDCSVEGSGCARVGMAESFIEPRYVESGGMTPAFDIGLIRLAEPVRSQAIYVPHWFDRIGSVGKLAGWGVTCRDLTPACNVRPAILQELNMQFVSSDRCDLGNLPSGEPVVDPRYVACVAAAGGREAMGCIGDSGALVGATLLVGDGDDLEPRVNDCNTSPRGGQGSGLSVRVAPSLPWIVSTMIDCNRARAAAHSANTLSAATPRWRQYALAG